MNILVIPVQSVSNLITNSSSEVFILETGKTCEEVNTILNTFTSGFRHPEVFSLKDFREWRKKLRSGEIEEDWSYPGTIFSIANGWFKDPEDEEDLLNLRMDFLFNPFDTEEIIQKHDIKNAAFGAHFVEYLKTSKIKTHLYPPESLSKNVILTKDKVQITPSSFNLTPIKVIHV